MLDQLKHDDFEPLLHTKFQVHVAEGFSIPLELIDVRLMTSQPIPIETPVAVARSRSFALTFLGPKEPILPQQQYRFEHEGIGVIEGLFIVPIGAERNGIRYEAIFN